MQKMTKAKTRTHTLLVPIIHVLVQCSHCRFLCRPAEHSKVDREMPHRIRDHMRRDPLVDSMECVNHDTLQPEAHNAKEQYRDSQTSSAEIFNICLVCPPRPSPTRPGAGIGPSALSDCGRCAAQPTHPVGAVPLRELEHFSIEGPAPPHLAEGRCPSSGEVFSAIRLRPPKPILSRPNAFQHCIHTP